LAGPEFGILSRTVSRPDSEPSSRDDVIKSLTTLSESERDQIVFRFKERVSLFIHKDNDHTLRIDLTKTKTTKAINKLENSNPRYELELDLGIKKNSDK
jgi:hypothetical protein